MGLSLYRQLGLQVTHENTIGLLRNWSPLPNRQPRPHSAIRRPVCLLQAEPGLASSLLFLTPSIKHAWKTAFSFSEVLPADFRIKEQPRFHCRIRFACIQVILNKQTGFYCSFTFKYIRTGHIKIEVLVCLQHRATSIICSRTTTWRTPWFAVTVSLLPTNLLWLMLGKKTTWQMLSSRFSPLRPDSVVHLCPELKIQPLVLWMEGFLGQALVAIMRIRTERRQVIAGCSTELFVDFDLYVRYANFTLRSAEFTGSIWEHFIRII